MIVLFHTQQGPADDCATHTQTKSSADECAAPHQGPADDCAAHTQIQEFSR